VLKSLVEVEIEVENTKIIKQSHILDHVANCVFLLDASMTYLDNPGLFLEEQIDDRIAIMIRGLLTFSTLNYLTNNKAAEGLTHFFRLTLF
jgi:hypothetical protein